MSGHHILPDVTQQRSVIGTKRGALCMLLISIGNNV